MFKAQTILVCAFFVCRKSVGNSSVARPLNKSTQ